MIRILAAILSTFVLASTAAGDSIVGWGTNGHGELGGGYRSPFSSLPVSVKGLSGIKQVVSTYKSGFALLEDGTIRAWGGNAFGQLGDGTHHEKLNPVPVKVLSQVVQIAAGGGHVMALLSNGTVWTWGGNAHGQLGNGTKGLEGEPHPFPMRVPGLKDVVSIAAGGADDAAILANGKVVAWGENAAGQLGDGTTVEKDVPTPVKRLSSVRSVAIGGIGSLGAHTLALLNDGTVMVTGDNKHGQLGLGNTTDRLVPVSVPGLSHVTAVSASASHSLALLSNGTVKAWGSDDHGELGAPAREACGTAACSRSPRSVGLPNVSAISAGWRFSLAVSSRRASAWGWNDRGQLGNGSTTDSITPVPVRGISGVIEVSAGESFSLALLAGSGPPP